MTVAVCPGSFDPPTNGHLDVIQRASRIFDEVVVCVVKNPSKSPLMTAEERVALLSEALEHLPNVRVSAYEGLLVDFARDQGAAVIVKGLRAMSDVEKELQMAQMNSGLFNEVDTLFVTTDPQWSFVSSSMVKEVAALGGDVSALVPPTVNQALRRHFGSKAH